MKIAALLWTPDTELHIWSRHQVTTDEVETAAYRHGLAIRGRGPGIYEIFGRTEAGRYLMAAVRCKGRGEAVLITARDMSRAERRRYKRCTAH